MHHDVHGFWWNFSLLDHENDLKGGLALTHYYNVLLSEYRQVRLLLSDCQLPRWW